jgi:hypothetical protein
MEPKLAVLGIACFALLLCGCSGVSEPPFKDCGYDESCLASSLSAGCGNARLKAVSPGGGSAEMRVFASGGACIVDSSVYGPGGELLAGELVELALPLQECGGNATVSFVSASGDCTLVLPLP